MRDRRRRLRRRGGASTFEVVVRRVVLTVFALAVFLPSMALARTQYLCDADLVIRTTCCCPPKKAKRPITVPTIQRECCQVTEHVPVLPPAATAPDAPSIPMAVIVPVAIAPVMPPVVGARLAIRPRAQAPPLERSLFSQHAALLL